MSAGTVRRILVGMTALLLVAAGLVTYTVARTWRPVWAPHPTPPPAIVFASPTPEVPDPRPSTVLDLAAGDTLATAGPGELLTWAVADVNTGDILATSPTGGTSSTESMIKPWLAADYLTTHPTVDTAHLAEITSAIRDSDDTAAQDLYQADGGDLSIARLSTTCGVAAAISHSWWSRTQVTAVDAARLGVCLADGRAAGPTWTLWLMDQMRGVAGPLTDQHPGHGGGRWGIIDAPALHGHDVAIKNGWTLRDDGRWHVNCLAIVDGQWSLAVLTQYPAGLGLAHGAAQCTAVARELTVPASAPSTTGPPG